MAQSAGNIRWAFLVPGFTVLIARYMEAKKLAEAAGANLAAPKEYATVSTYYNDFAAGNYDVCIGSWDVFAQRYEAGVPIKMLCTITSASMIAIVTGNPDVKAVPDLKGKTLAAPQSTGTFRMVSSLIKERYGLELGKDINIQGVDNPASSMTMVLADRADGGLSWEPNISSTLARRKDLRVTFNAGAAYREISDGAELPYFGIAVRRELAERDPEQVTRIRKAFESCITGILADPNEAVGIVADKTGAPPAVLLDALTSKRLSFRFGSMTSAEERANVTKAGEFLKRNGLLKNSVAPAFFIET
ncbi:ABC transporter substrate-binding protein (plasmid) [Bosea vestrisii]|uniref:ABC transporter substrate-binding protein n=1 Tax=Bosea vestrisii TaxID=151416 RepID=UPI0024DF775B|nr:ABC transporter substrate-binding protein [Bosea vestrisii]WID99812.1 ABC transporter substrate-binding protein [Bosea vestrisii]